MSDVPKYGWECRFCSEKLKQQSLVGWHRLLWLLPIRTFRCPHCFQLFRKPITLVSMIPVIGTLFCEKKGGTVAVSDILSKVTRKRRRRTYERAGMLVRLARWTETVETKFTDALELVMRSVSLIVLSPFRWLSQRLSNSARDSFPPLSAQKKRRTKVRRNNG